jgi:putative ABC transport system permease protein
VARLKPGTSPDQAKQQLSHIAAQLEQQHPATNRNRGVHAEPWRESLVGGLRRAVWMLFGAVALLLAVACANVANLLMVRAAVRRKELSLRAALGATRGRIARQLLVECLLLTGVGGTLGLLLAQSALGVTGIILRQAIPMAGDPSLGGAIASCLGGLVLVIGIAFGVAPALDAQRIDLQLALKSGSPGVAAGSNHRLRRSIVVAQIALTIVLLHGAGLCLRSFLAIQNVDLGFVPERVLSFRVTLPAWKYQPDRRASFHAELTEKLRALPGVSGVSVTSKVPLDNTGSSTRYSIQGRPPPEKGADQLAEISSVGLDYFRVMGIPLLKGRGFQDTDVRAPTGAADASRRNADTTVAIIDAEFARQHWSDRNPIGERVILGRGTEATIVGVMGRVQLGKLTEETRTPQVYVPFWHQTRANMAFVVKTALPEEATMGLVRAQLRAIDPDVPLSESATVAELYTRSSTPQRAGLVIVGLFAAIAFLLAAVGLYGTTAYSVAQRQGEMGIRIALGARPGDVKRLVLMDGLRLATLGVAVGLACAFALSRLLRGFFFAVSPGDAATLAAVIALSALMTALACWLPARRAARVDPMIALRTE